MRHARRLNVSGRTKRGFTSFKRAQSSLSSPRNNYLDHKQQTLDPSLVRRKGRRKPCCYAASLTLRLQTPISTSLRCNGIGGRAGFVTHAEQFSLTKPLTLFIRQSLCSKWPKHYDSIVFVLSNCSRAQDNNLRQEGLRPFWFHNHLHEAD
jgi:hypothetical protein